MVEGDANSALGVWHARCALNRSERPCRKIDAHRVPLESVAQAKLNRSIEQLVGQSQKTARGSREIALPTQEIVGLSGQDVDHVVLDLQIRVPDTEGRVVEIRGFGRGTGPRRHSRRSPTTVDPWLVAEQIKLEDARWTNSVQLRCLC